MDAGGGKDAAAAVSTVRGDACDLGFIATLELCTTTSASVHHDGHSSVPNMSVDSLSLVQQQQRQQVVDVINRQILPNEHKVSSMKLYSVSFNAP